MDQAVEYRVYISIAIILIYRSHKQTCVGDLDKREGVHHLYSIFTLHCMVVSQSMYVQYVIDIVTLANYMKYRR